MEKLNLNEMTIELTADELLNVNGGSAGDAAYSIGYGIVIGQVMLVGGAIPAAYLTYKWAERMFS